MDFIGSINNPYSLMALILIIGYMIYHNKNHKSRDIDIDNNIFALEKRINDLKRKLENKD